MANAGFSCTGTTNPVSKVYFQSRKTNLGGSSKLRDWPFYFLSVGIEQKSSQEKIKIVLCLGIVVRSTESLPHSLDSGHDGHVPRAISSHLPSPFGSGAELYTTTGELIDGITSPVPLRHVGDKLRKAYGHSKPSDALSKK